MSHLRIFGCDAYAHIPKAERGKFDAKSMKCSLVGYCENQKAFRVLDHMTGKIIISRDVLFHEKPTLTEHNKPNQYVPPQDEDSPLREEVSTEIANTQALIPNKSTRITKQPDRLINDPQLGKSAKSGTFLPDAKEPGPYKEALKSISVKRWQEAMDEEINSLIKNGTREIQELPAGRRAIKRKWTYKIKRDSDGCLNRFKTRLVAKGCSQKEGLDYK